MKYIEPSTPRHDMTKLIRLMGGLVVFLRICLLRKRRDGSVRNPQDGKRVAHKWKHLTLADMTQEWLDSCANWPGAIAVKLGRVNIDDRCEAGLYALDTDIDAEVSVVEDLNPWTADSYRQRGGKGAQWLFRGAGEWPAKTVSLYDSRHIDAAGNFPLWGEFRSDGGISVIDGDYAHGGTYQHNGTEVTTIRFLDLALPSYVSAHRRSQVLLGIGEHSNRLLSGIQLSIEASFPGPDRSLPPIATAPVDYAQLVLPFAPHTKGNHHNALIFGLASSVKLRQVQGLAVDLVQVFHAWWAKAGKCCPPILGPDYYWMELQRAVACSRGGALAAAWAASKGMLAPGAQVLMAPHLRRLASFCYALQQLRGDNKFVLPYRVCATVFASVCPGCDRMDAFGWFKVLEFQRLVTKLKAGIPGSGSKGSGTANEWRYIGRNL